MGKVTEHVCCVRRKGSSEGGRGKEEQVGGKLRGAGEVGINQNRVLEK